MVAGRASAAASEAFIRRALARRRFPSPLSGAGCGDKPRADRMALHGEFEAWLHRVTQAALAPGAGGWIDDDVAIFRSPWGFDSRSIRVPVKLWHGLDDPTVSIEHARWLAENIPGAQAQLRPVQAPLQAPSGLQVRLVPDRLQRLPAFGPCGVEQSRVVWRR